MKIVYISSSVIPSRTANSIHVMKMCQAFAKNGHQVTLLAPDNHKDYEPSVDDFYDYYGVDRCFDVIKLPWFNVKGRGYIYGALAALKSRKLKPDLVFGRNAIGCSLSGFLGLPVMFESHSPVTEDERLVYWLFDKLSHSKNLKKFVVITHSLKEYYLSTRSHLANKIHVAPDGADPIASDVQPVAFPSTGKRMQVGYVGHLYKGKGMEVVFELANHCGWADFHVVGGLEADIAYWQAKCSKIENIKFHGYVSNRKTTAYQKAFDVLLLPNQEKVSAHGNYAKVNRDIGSWTSPLKLFEYMAVRKPIIASDLPVLREILSHEHNVLLCTPYDASQWVQALERLRDDTALGQRLAGQSYLEFMESYTWQARAKKLIGDAS
jgi:glycosyltransferase involved in cell wall biosynthesis